MRSAVVEISVQDTQRIQSGNVMASNLVTHKKKNQHRNLERTMNTYILQQQEWRENHAFT